MPGHGGCYIIIDTETFWMQCPYHSIVYRVRQMGDRMGWAIVWDGRSHGMGAIAWDGRSHGMGDRMGWAIAWDGRSPVQIHHGTKILLDPL